MTNRRTQGSQGEALARTLLETKGFRFVGSNYYCRWGELDLIMLDQNTLVFVEVRMRRSERFGTAMESITRTKQSRLMRSAQDYLLHHPHAGPLRFDVVGILMAAGMTRTQHLENAIESSSFM
ncbi:MAG: YraN family protein [Candidatus Melainabacteria bacterium HGW-Melainabacteria-1]|nr:MAG: YraN family protein [Candidatus Melainabacteria bacterium HGW-Melainabacteria-1]